MKLRVSGIPRAVFAQLRDGARRERKRPLVCEVEGAANPRRHGLQLIALGAEKLVLNYRPFPRAQPYAETGRIFLHTGPCTRYEGADLPAWLHFLDPAAVRGYDCEDWVRYETGTDCAERRIVGCVRCDRERPTIAYVHIRSKFDCFQCRVDRA